MLKRKEGHVKEKMADGKEKLSLKGTKLLCNQFPFWFLCLMGRASIIRSENPASDIVTLISSKR